ncbi:unnamed protein product [Urochloa humidicola]
MASASTLSSISGKLLLNVPSPHMGSTRRRSPLSVAVRGPTPAQGKGGDGGKVHATPRPAILAVGGRPPAEGTGGSGGKVHAAPAWALMSVGGTAQLNQLPAEGTGGRGGIIHAVPDAAPAAKKA